MLALVFRRKRGKHSKIEPYLFMLVILVVLPMSVGMACDPDTTPTPSGNAPIPPPSGTPIPPPTGTPPPTDTPIPPTQTPMPECDIQVRLQYPELVAARIYYEGASSIGSDAPNRQEIFRKMLYALKSLHEVYSGGVSYVEFTNYEEGTYNPVSISKPGDGIYPDLESIQNFYTVYANSRHEAPYDYVQQAINILSFPGCGDGPFAGLGSIHWTSPQNWPRKDANQRLIYINASGVTDCQEFGTCILRDVRQVPWARNHAIDYWENGTPISINEKEECYWEGVYFSNEGNYNAMVFGAPQQNNPPTDDEYRAGDLTCSKYGLP